MPYRCVILIIALTAGSLAAQTRPATQKTDGADIRTPLFWVRNASEAWHRLPERLKLDANLARLQFLTNDQAGLEAMIAQVKRRMPRDVGENAEDRAYGATCAELIGVFAARGDEAAIREAIRWTSHTKVVNSVTRARVLTALVDAGRGADAMDIAAAAEAQEAIDAVETNLTIAVAAGRRGERALYERALDAARRVPGRFASKQEIDAMRAVNVAEAMIDAGEVNEALRAAAAMGPAEKAVVLSKIAERHLERGQRAEAAKYARMAASTVRKAVTSWPGHFGELGRRLALVGDQSALADFNRIVNEFKVPPPPMQPESAPRRKNSPPCSVPLAVYGDARQTSARTAYFGMAQGYAQSGDGAGALKYLKIAETYMDELARRIGGPTSERQGQSGINTADLELIRKLQDSGATDAALALAKMYLAVPAATQPGDAEPFTLRTNLLAAAYARDGRHAEAEKVIASVRPEFRHEYYRGVALRHADQGSFAELLAWMETIPPVHHYDIYLDVAQALVRKADRLTTRPAATRPATPTRR